MPKIIFYLSLCSLFFASGASAETLDHKPYIEPVSGKRFVAESGDTRTVYVVTTRTIDGGYRVIRQRSRYRIPGGEWLSTRIYIYAYETRSDGVYWKSLRSRDCEIQNCRDTPNSANGTAFEVYNINPAVPVLKTLYLLRPKTNPYYDSNFLGAWSGDYADSYSNPNRGVTGKSVFPETYKVIKHLPSVTVKAGTYNDCIIVQRHTGYSLRNYTYCRNVGLVRETNTNAPEMELVRKWNLAP